MMQAREGVLVSSAGRSRRGFIDRGKGCCFPFAAGLTTTLIDGDGLVEELGESSCSSDNSHSVFDIVIQFLIKDRTLRLFVPIEGFYQRLEFGGVR